jgi:hypothetical protein
MSRSSATLETINSYGSFLMEKLRIGNCHSSLQQRDAQYRVGLTGFAVVNALDDGYIFNVGHYLSEVQISLSEWWGAR